MEKNIDKNTYEPKFNLAKILREPPPLRNTAAEMMVN